MNKKILLLLFHTIILGQGSITVYDQKYKVEITRDEWGVPHVHGKTDADVGRPVEGDYYGKWKQDDRFIS